MNEDFNSNCRACMSLGETCVDCHVEYEKRKERNAMIEKVKSVGHRIETESGAYYEIDEEILEKLKTKNRNETEQSESILHRKTQISVDKD